MIDKMPSLRDKFRAQELKERKEREGARKEVKKARSKRVTKGRASKKSKK